MSCKDGDDEVVDIDEGDDGHKICSKADVPITGRSSDPEDDELSFGGEYRKRSTSSLVTPPMTSMIIGNNLKTKDTHFSCY